MVKSSFKYSPTVISLFSGAGGLDLGFMQEGFEIIWANDNDGDSVLTYKKNLGNHIVLDDIENINLIQIPDADIVIGGFPCQGFSIANVKRSVEDERNSLYKKFAEVLKAKRPRIFLAENVKGILTLAKGEFFRKIIRDFSKEGYRCSFVLLNAAHYGVPQTRFRIFILGIRDDVNNPIHFPPRPTHLSNPITIGEALKDIPEPTENHSLANHQNSKFKLKFNGYISNRFVDPNKPSPTITARGDKKGGAMIIHHPSNKRRLTCREAAIIQGFPINYNFHGSMTSVYRQIGNAVPPQLARAVAREIMIGLKNEKSIKLKTARGFNFAQASSEFA